MPLDLAELSAAGYLPTDVDLVTGAVKLARLAAADFRETWYDDTVAAGLGAATATVAIGSFIPDGGGTGSPAPLRVIAHVSRCGSTSMANLLALRSTTMVLKEPDFVTDVAKGIALSSDDVERRRYQELLAGLLNYTSRVAYNVGRVPVVKVTSWTVPIVMACLDNTSNVTWLLQWREPGEVVSSNEADPPSWGAASESGQAARQAVGVDPSRSDDVELYGSVWAGVVGTFAESSVSLRYRTLAYRQFRDDKARSLREVEAWFGIEVTGLPAGFIEESVRYSKGGHAELFDPAGVHRRKDLDASAAHQVQELTGWYHRWLQEAAQHRLF